jgi:hypothetical protein
MKERHIEENNNTVNSCYARYSRRHLRLLSLAQYKHLQMPMSFLQRLVRDYTGIHSSSSLSKLSGSLLSVDNIL